MRKWCNILNSCYFDTSVLYSTDGGLSTCTRAFNKYFSFTHTQVISNLCAICSSHLCSVRSVLFRTFKTHFTSRSPRDNLSCVVGY